jgi:hypothetical protein
MIDMASGETVATAAVGREGAIDLLSVLGPSPSDATAIVRVAGTASRIPGPQFHAAFNRSPAIRRAGAMLMKFQLGAACNSVHPVKARMARWLLHFRDRIDHDVVPRTQEALSQILGVRRTTVIDEAKSRSTGCGSRPRRANAMALCVSNSRRSSR